MQCPNTAWKQAVDMRGASVVCEHRVIAITPRRPRLLDRVRLELRAEHYRPKTEKSYVAWIRRYVLFHGKRQPSEIGADVVRSFLSWLASETHASSSTQNQASSALLFLYRDVLGGEIGWIDNVLPTKRSTCLPVALIRSEVRAVLGQLKGTLWLMASLMYGAGLRLMNVPSHRVSPISCESCSAIAAR